MRRAVLIVRGTGPKALEDFLGYHERRPGLLTVGISPRDISEGFFVRLGDREELSTRLGEDFEERFTHEGDAFLCGDVLLWDPGESSLAANEVVARPRQLYYVYRQYGPRYVKSGQVERAVIEVLEHDVVRQRLTLRRHPVK